MVKLKVGSLCTHRTVPSQQLNELLLQTVIPANMVIRHVSIYCNPVSLFHNWCRLKGLNLLEVSLVRFTGACPVRRA